MRPSRSNGLTPFTTIAKELKISPNQARAAYISGLKKLSRWRLMQQMQFYQNQSEHRLLLR